jgi:hypothetical protein
MQYQLLVRPARKQYRNRNCLKMLLKNLLEMSYFM